jgi:hypothetical protein
MPVSRGTSVPFPVNRNPLPFDVRHEFQSADNQLTHEAARLHRIATQDRSPVGEPRQKIGADSLSVEGVRGSLDDLEAGGEFAPPIVRST